MPSLSRTGSFVLWARIVLLSLTAFMIWEALFHEKFDLVFRRPFKNAIELSYFAPILGSVVFLGIAIYDLVRGRRTVLRGSLSLLLELCWCLVLAFCLILMAVRTGI